MRGIKRTVSFIAALDISFVGLLVLSSLLTGIASDILYYTAFLAPILLGFWAIRYQGGVQGGTTVSDTLSFSAPLIFPTVTTVCTLAAVSSFLLGLLGFEHRVTFDIPFWEAAVLHALIPAVLEEMLFRFIPITLLRKENASAGYVLIFTSITFSLAHTSLYSIPYAFLAGAVFAFTFMATGSVLPSVLVHLINNFVSLLTVYYDFDFWVYLALAFLSLISVIVVFWRRSIYITKAKELFSQKSELYITAPAVAFIAICSVLSILTLS